MSLDFAAAERELSPVLSTRPEAEAFFDQELSAHSLPGQSRPSGHYYWEIVLPGSVLGLIVGYATQQYGRARIA